MEVEVELRKIMVMKVKMEEKEVKEVLPNIILINQLKQQFKHL